jgi:hypothetical protein
VGRLKSTEVQRRGCRRAASALLTSAAVASGRRVGDWFGVLPPRQPPLIEPCVRLTLTRLSDGVHVAAVSSTCHLGRRLAEARSAEAGTQQREGDQPEG